MSDMNEQQQFSTPQLAAQDKMTAPDAWWLTIGCMIGWSAFSLPTTVLLPNAGFFGTTIALVLGAAVMIIIALNFRLMVNEMPVEGGAYSYTLSMFGKLHGFICAFALVFFYIVYAASSAVALSRIERALLGGFLAFGPHYELFGYDVYLVEVAIELVVVALAVLIVVRGRLLSKYTQMLLGIVLVIGILTVVGFGSVEVSSTALDFQALLASSQSGVLGSIMAFSLTPLLFVGFEATPQAMGSMGFSARKVGPIMISAILFTTLTCIGMTYITAQVVPEGFATWTDYMAANPDLFGLEAMPTFYAAYDLLGEAGYNALCATAICASIMSVIGFTLLASRLLFMMAKESELPQWFCKSNKTGVPVNAALFVALVALLAILVGRTALSWALDIAPLGGAVAFAYTSAAAYRYASKHGRKPQAVIGAFGIVFSIVFVALYLIPLPGFGVQLDGESYVVLIILIALGINFYNPDYSASESAPSTVMASVSENDVSKSSS